MITIGVTALTCMSRNSRPVALSRYLGLRCVMPSHSCKGNQWEGLNGKRLFPV